jgi:hypothetical protein
VVPAVAIEQCLVEGRRHQFSSFDHDPALPTVMRDVWDIAFVRVESFAPFGARRRREGDAVHGLRDARSSLAAPVATRRRPVGAFGGVGYELNVHGPVVESRGGWRVGGM